MNIRLILTVTFMSLGFMCFIASAVGVFRMKDFHCRLHAASICESLGLFLASLGLFIYEGFTLTGIKIFMVFTAVFISSPIGTHIIAKVNSKHIGEGEEQ